MDKGIVRIGYWDCRGYLEPIKLLLEYTATRYEVTAHKCGPPPHYDKDEWMAEKAEILADFDFPNLPYYDDGEDNRLTHVMAIVQHLGRKHGLVPEAGNESEWADMDMVREQVLEMRDAVVAYVYFPEHRAKVRRGLNGTLKTG